MSEFFGFKIDASTLPWSKGENPNQLHPALRQEKLAELLRAIQQGNLELANQCLLALIHMAPSIESHSLVIQLKSALKRSNTVWAQKIAQELKALGLSLFDHRAPLAQPKAQEGTIRAAQKPPHIDLLA
jgi:hypothetical protein